MKKNFCNHDLRNQKLNLKHRNLLNPSQNKHGDVHLYGTKLRALDSIFHCVLDSLYDKRLAC